jgi:bacillolysin
MRRVMSVCGALAVVLISQTPTSGQQTAFAPQGAISTIAVNATRLGELRQWDSFITDSSRSGALRLRSTDRDPALPTHLVERFDQFYNGVRIWGADIVRDSEYGVPVSVFGVISPELDLATDPALSEDAARTALRTLAGTAGVVLADPQLVIARLNSGEHRLAYTGVISNNDAEVDRAFVDAHTGTELMRYSEVQTQATVASGRGVLGSRKKMSVLKEAATYFADDQLRPPLLRTFDMRGSVSRLISVVNGGALLSSERAANSSTEWSDSVAVDAHAHIGLTYDYYYKRHSRRGLDNRDRPIVGLINGVSQAGALSLPVELADLAINAFWCGACGPGRIGVMYFGNGIPQQFTFNGQTVNYLAGSLDIIAHELTHGVTESTSALAPFGESGALNEAFSDIMGTSVEFAYQPPGSGLEQADYEIGEDSFRGASVNVNGIRSLSNPQSHLQGGSPSPDHYSRRYIGSEDNGGVHINAGIPGHAFYLAIEGGTNRTSGLSVQGVGPANREQIEKVFYRAFTLLMPSASSFATARAATIQAARDLYGSGGAVERAITQAWDAVGVFPQATITFSFSPSPATARTQCGTLTPPCWAFRTTVQESSGIGFTVTSTTAGFFDSGQNLIGTASIPFSQVFTSCGAGSSRIAPRASACADIVFGLGGRSSGFIAFRLEGRDDNGVTLSFVSPLERLAPLSSPLGPPSFAAPGFEILTSGGQQ